MRAKQPAKCANGCDRPAEEPWFCICQVCVDKITATLHAEADSFKRETDAKGRAR